MPIHLRRARLDDVPHIVRIHASGPVTWRNEQGTPVPGPEGLSLYARYLSGGPWTAPETAAVHLHHLLREEGCYPWVAEVDGTVRGMAEAFLEEDPVWGRALAVGILWVEAGWRRQGVGRALMGALLEQAGRLRCHTLAVPNGKREAAGFYRRLGFEEWGAVEVWEVRAADAEAAPRVEGLPDLPYEAVRGLPLRVGRDWSARQAWLLPRLWPALPELGEHLPQRLRLAGPAGEGILILAPAPGRPGLWDAFLWTAAPDLTPFLAWTAAEVARRGGARLRLGLPREAREAALAAFGAPEAVRRVPQWGRRLRE